MNITIDVTPLKDKNKTRGIGIYTKFLIEALQKYENKHSYHFISRGENISKSTDLIHYPYFDPFYLTLPLLKSKPTVVTIHDLIPIVFPDRFPSGIRGQIGWVIQRLSLQSVKEVITDSKSSAIDINKFTKVPIKNTNVIYLAPSPTFKRVDNLKIQQRVKRKYSLPEKYILYVGDVNWNKNILGLLEAFSLLKNINLVCVGEAFLNNSIIEMLEISKVIDRLGLSDRIQKLKSVVEGDLAVIYSMAQAYIQPSFYEGFGLPVLEAMACGCPVILSDSSSLREIAGPSKLIDPHDPCQMAECINKVLRLNSDDRQKLSKESREWANDFSWKKVAHETIAVYEKVLYPN